MVKSLYHVGLNCNQKFVYSGRVLNLINKFPEITIILCHKKLSKYNVKHTHSRIYTVQYT